MLNLQEILTAPETHCFIHGSSFVDPSIVQSWKIAKLLTWKQNEKKQGITKKKKTVIKRGSTNREKRNEVERERCRRRRRQRRRSTRKCTSVSVPVWRAVPVGAAAETRARFAALCAPSRKFASDLFQSDH